MADYTVTAANVVPSSQAVMDRTHTAGVGALARGDVAYYDDESLGGTKTWLKMDSNASATGNGITAVKGLVASDAGPGQPVAVILKDPDLTHGLTGVVAGDVIIASATAGKQAPYSDAATGWYVTVLGVAKSATKMNFEPVSAGAAK